MINKTNTEPQLFFLCPASCILGIYVIWITHSCWSKFSHSSQKRS